MIDDVLEIIMSIYFTKDECYKGSSENMKDGLKKFGVQWYFAAIDTQFSIL